MDAPLISVLLPVRDGAQTVERAVKSMLAQRDVRLELIAVDDGSTDDTAAVLERLALGDSRLRCVHQPPSGIVGALRRALSHATGDFVARMDADDESSEDRLGLSLAALDADPSLDGVGTGVEVTRSDRPPSPNLVAYAQWLSSLTSPDLVFRDRYVESPLCHPSVLLRRSAMERFGAWEDVPFPEDWELWLRWLEAGARLSVVPHVLHRWADHDRRLTRTDARYERARHVALKARYLAKRVEGVPLTIWGAGEVGLSLARALLEEGVRPQTFVELHPRKVGQRIHGARVIHADALGPPPAVGHLLAAVGAKGARADIRARLASLGWVEGTHFTAVA